ncbi:hypothetical protein [Phyllobacterium endophyticum]|uniref:hypothetical protein n=1 Tax=Phyllobacterium endophyticum TaxID=1149773 RepID=UPI0011C882C1|nr:hypothetical protein [Phyllobacterium endophyticum]TXR50454.1 hypothetical protein FVA77_03965 [Phyllobacterium endophyticum]
MTKQKNPVPATVERASIDVIDPVDINTIRGSRRELMRRLLSCTPVFCRTMSSICSQYRFEKDRFIGARTPRKGGYQGVDTKSLEMVAA